MKKKQPEREWCRCRKCHPSCHCSAAGETCYLCMSGWHRGGPVPEHLDCAKKKKSKPIARRVRHRV